MDAMLKKVETHYGKLKDNKKRGTKPVPAAEEEAEVLH
jgi:hypothetical protein